MLSKTLFAFAGMLAAAQGKYRLSTWSGTRSHSPN